MDRRLGIETMSPPLAEADRAKPSHNPRNSPYEPLTYAALRRIGEFLKLESGDLLYDLGCGKGRMICWFARERIRGCVGVELDATLAEAARANANALVGRQTPIEIRTSDATLEDYSEATVVTLYNPFDSEVMRRILIQLEASLDSNPRRVRIAYAAPRARAVFQEFLRFVQVAEMSAPYDLGSMALLFFEAR